MRRPRGSAGELCDGGRNVCAPGGGDETRAPEAKSRQDQRGRERPEDPRGRSLPRLAAAGGEEERFRREHGGGGEARDVPVAESCDFGGIHFHRGANPVARPTPRNNL